MFSEILRSVMAGICKVKNKVTIQTLRLKENQQVQNI